jgi:hypothetical protein
MRLRIAVAVLFSGAAFCASAQIQSKSGPPAARLGMSCDQILKMSSTEWIAYAHDHSADAVAAISAYGGCYDARTNALASRLVRSGRGPSARAKSNFQDFDKSIQDFSAKALASTIPPADAVKSAYSALYEKQFRYEFYEGYEAKPASSPTSSAKIATTHPKGDAKPAPTASSESASSDHAAVNVDDMTQAKNHFGELLGALTEDKLHELHAAFGRILGLHSEDPATQLALYRYAIFLLEPAPIAASQDQGSAKPFSAPPF